MRNWPKEEIDNGGQFRGKKLCLRMWSSWTAHCGVISVKNKFRAITLSCLDRFLSLDNILTTHTVKSS